MYEGQKVSVIIPFRNEAAHIAEVVKGIPGFIDFIIAVDDSSGDDGPSILAGLGDPRVLQIRNGSRLGVGGTIMRGHLEAKNRDSKVNVVMAGDGQMDPHYLPMLLDAIICRGFDYAKGNRFMSRNQSVGMPTNRLVGNLILGLLMKFISGYWSISDPQNGYTALRTSALDRMEWWHVWKGYFFENDMLIHLNVARAKVCDFPIPARYGSEKSGIRLSSFIPLTFLLMTHRIFWRLWKES